MLVSATMYATKMTSQPNDAIGDTARLSVVEGDERMGAWQIRAACKEEERNERVWTGANLRD